MKHTHLDFAGFTHPKARNPVSLMSCVFLRLQRPKYTSHLEYVEMGYGGERCLSKRHIQTQIRLEIVFLSPQVFILVFRYEKA